MPQERLDWGVDEDTGADNEILYPVVHHPSGMTVWLSKSSLDKAKEALINHQVPGKLGEKLQAFIKEKTGL